MDIVDFIKKAAERTGFRREKYIEKNLPTSPDNIMIMLFYGDMRSEFILSSLLLHRIRSLHPSKYFILCSYGGRAELYPYVDEFWSPLDETQSRDLADAAVGFGNHEENKVLFQERQLLRYFADVVRPDDKHYKNGLTKDFFEEFKWVVYSLPAVPSPAVEFNRTLSQRSGFKVFVYPARKLRTWVRGREDVLDIKRGFWEDLVSGLGGAGFTPVICQDFGTYELSGKHIQARGKLIDQMGMMRATGCVLDVFSGVSRWAIAARTPWVACMDRHLYNSVKEYEIDGLCSNNIPFRYIFSFPTIIGSGQWGELIDTITGKLDGFMETLNRDSWPSTADLSVVAPYSLVKIKKRKKIGTNFIRVPKV